MMDNDLGDQDFYKDGYAILKEIVLNQQRRPTEVQLVTANSVAAERMSNLLCDVGYKASPSRRRFGWRG